MWLFFALLSPLLWAIVHLLDWQLVNHVFERPWMGVITSSLASIAVFLILPFIATAVDWQQMSWSIAMIAIGIGVLIQLSQACYFQALAYSEVGIVAAYWNITPALLPLASFLLYGAVLKVIHYVGIAILIFASISFCLLDSSLNTRWQSFYLMFAASVLQVVAILLEKYIFDRGSFFLGFLLITTGIILTGILPLGLRKIRNPFFKSFKNLDSLLPVLSILMGIEMINLAALFTSQRAIALGLPPLVAAVETTIPAYTFTLSIVLTILFPQVGDPNAHHQLWLKLGLVGLMALAVWLIS